MAYGIYCTWIQYRDSEAYLKEAIDKLDHLPTSRVEKVSSFLVTAPYGVTDQPDFLNGCLKLQTLLYPEELLRELNRIEQEAGRERIIHWGPRTLDLDIIFYDDLICEEDDLCIPHIEMHKRSFVLKPLEEIAPYKRHPVTGKTVRGDAGENWRMPVRKPLMRDDRDDNKRLLEKINCFSERIWYDDSVVF